MVDFKVMSSSTISRLCGALMTQGERMMHEKSFCILKASVVNKIKLFVYQLPFSLSRSY